jgi:ATP-dependent DNA helicase RecQ
MERAKIVNSLLRQVNHGHSLIFVPTKKIGEMVKTVFSKLEQNFPFYHGNLPYLKRERIIGRFTGRIKPPLKTIICTNAFGMGIDVPDIRVIVHWQHPASIEDYIQELGRAGRDGKNSIALLFMTENEKDLLKYMAKCTVEGAHLSPDQSKEALRIRLNEIDQMNKIAHASGCFRQQILLSMGFEIKNHRRSLARWLVDRLLVKKNIITLTGGCCDECDPLLKKSVHEGEIVTWQDTHYF